MYLFETGSIVFLNLCLHVSARLRDCLCDVFECIENIRLFRLFYVIRVCAMFLQNFTGSILFLFLMTILVYFLTAKLQITTLFLTWIQVGI